MNANMKQIYLCKASANPEILSKYKSYLMHYDINDDTGDECCCYVPINFEINSCIVFDLKEEDIIILSLQNTYIKKINVLMCSPYLLRSSGYYPTI